MRSYLPRAARTVRVLRRCESAAAEEGGLWWMNKFVVDLEMNDEEERSNLGEGFGRVEGVDCGGDDVE